VGPLFIVSPIHTYLLPYGTTVSNWDVTYTRDHPNTLFSYSA
jgi:hypothetical protein